MHLFKHIPQRWHISFIKGLILVALGILFRFFPGTELFRISYAFINYGFFELVFPLVTIIHEAGHLLAALAMRLKVIEVVIGEGKEIFRRSFFNIPLVIKEFNAGGKVGAELPNERWRIKHIIYSSGSFLLLALVFFTIDYYTGNRNVFLKMFSMDFAYRFAPDQVCMIMIFIPFVLEFIPPSILGIKDPEGIQSDLQQILSLSSFSSPKSLHLKEKIAHAFKIADQLIVDPQEILNKAYLDRGNKIYGINDKGEVSPVIHQGFINAIETNRLDIAIVWCQKLLSTHSEYFSSNRIPKESVFVELCLGFGLHAWKNNNLERARSLFEAGIKSNIYYPQLKLNLADFYGKNGEGELAEQLLQELQSDKDFMDKHGVVFRQTYNDKKFIDGFPHFEKLIKDEMFSEAEKIMTNALESLSTGELPETRKPDILRHLSYTLIEQYKFEEALAILKILIDSPESDEKKYIQMNNCAWSEMCLGFPNGMESADTYSEKAYLLNANPAIASTRAGVLIFMGKVEEGLKILPDPQSVETDLNKGLIFAQKALGLFKSGDLEGATEALNKANELASDHPLVRLIVEEINKHKEISP
jgi:tetratricopeptide (TPR) repeat protein